MNRLVLACLALFVVAAFASSHSEAPGTAKRPNADITDFYMFRCYEPGREEYTCFIMNSNPLQHPFAGPNYYTLSDDHFFELYIDNDGDSHEDITFQFFNGNSLGGAQANVPYHADEDDCVLNQNFRNVNPQPTYIRKNAGVTLPIGNQNVRVALKVVGPVTRNDQSSLNWNEWYQINYITGDRTFGTRTPIHQSGSNNVKFIKPFDNAGTKSFPNYEDYASQYVYNINIPGCNQDGRVFLGQRAESFAISLGAVFDIINFIPIPGFPGAVKEDPLNNDLRNLNIDSYVLEVPTQCIVRSGENGVIGAWTGVRKLHHQGDDHVPGKQISRLGNPLVNELLIGLLDKGVFSTYEPHQDQGFVDFYVRYPTLPAIVNLLFGSAVNSVLGLNLATIAPTNIPRDDLYAVFMTGLDGLNQPKNVVPSEMLRLNTTVPPTAAGSQNQFGVIGGDGAGFPNGRRPGDDVVDIALRVMMGRLCTLNLYCVPTDAPVGNVDLTDGVPLSAANFDNAFPYLKAPYPGSTGLITA